DAYIYRGAIQRPSATSKLFLGVLGSVDQPIERNFNAILVAPHGNVQLATVAAGHQTSIYAKSILVRPNTIVTHTPFEPTDFCAGAPRCTGLCPGVTGSRSCDVGEPCSSNGDRSEEHTSELQSRENLVCRLLLEKKN